MGRLGVMPSGIEWTPIGWGNLGLGGCLSETGHPLFTADAIQALEILAALPSTLIEFDIDL